MSIIHERYSSNGFANILIFTGKRLSGIATDNLPVNVQIAEIDVSQEIDLKKWIQDTVLRHHLTNVFAFTAYRDLETYILCSTQGRSSRHLVQDGANFYFRVSGPVMLNRIKETLKIYRNLWRKGIFLNKLVLYKPHLAQCSFIDDVWVTNPEIFRKPRFSAKPLVKINLRLDGDDFLKYFGLSQKPINDHSMIYLSSRLTEERDIICEISLLKSITARLTNQKLLIKLHPASPGIQVRLFQEAFGDGVLKNAIPAELYIASAVNCIIVGVSSASLYYHNPRCTYFTLVKVYQRLKIFPEWIDISFPKHVTVLQSIYEFNLEPTG